MSLGDKDVKAILALLDDTPYDEFTLRMDNFTLHLQRKPGEGWTQRETVTADPGRETAVLEKQAAAAGSGEAETSPTESGLLEIRSPMVGTFYRAPKPGAEPFVDVGDRVEDSSVIGIVEVMKLMSSVPAGLNGEVAEILVDDASFVEKGQLLMRVRP